MSLLERLEVSFTREPKRARPDPRPAWLRRKRLDHDLEPTDTYSVRLYAQLALAPVAVMSLVYYTVWAAVLVWVGFKFGQSCPELFHRGRMQAREWHWVWRAVKEIVVGEQLWLYSLVPLAWALFSLLMGLPRMYFWNRRARRLRQEAGAVSDQTTDRAADATTWPPPPLERTAK